MKLAAPWAPPPSRVCQVGKDGVIGIRLQIYHPNIDVDGGVCLNILREDWKPVLCLSSVLLGIYHLFLVKASDSS